MELGSKVITLGCFLLIFGIFYIYYLNVLMFLPSMLIGFLLIIGGIFRNKGYSNKTYYLSSLSVVALWGLALLYIFLFMSKVYLTNKYLFYFNIILLICFLSTICKNYLQRHENLKMPWKNEG
jgi:uncharacterized membrane protein HdeD (DUF308 family)